ncbi:DUF5686 and carboxypeptidase regulatory-like domain-containing protein [Larkinella punicea]|uniref:Carboxypeptidase-like regulatory domain-containing protein n=1 Tax=Larkinella punicea TaxID=2315727 RepID=A0A368JMD7_9BACT|nr:DUF5686 and carboxypeptidase regulatory-like domain-containing protein [Larkinella punicea]RCR68672.1 carboxypeptidase-like regulatory domain-containing protein [Larkinella punicea]
MKYILTIFIFFFFINLVPAQGIRGTIKTSKGEVLPYAAIVVKGTSSGAITNSEGRYEVPLKPGKYAVVFQYLGFQAQEKAVEIGSDWQTVDVTMEEQAFRLQEVQAREGKEDPAYSIMRRAIAKARYHELQVMSYTAKAYTKTTFTITDLPMQFMYRKQLKEAEKEGFKIGVPMLYESVSEVTFKQPNTYRYRLMATRNSMGDNISVSDYFLTSFYRPEVNNAVSPLSPKAFAYYKFEYQGTFSERGIDVSKIQVNPRAYGEGVFRGTIFIIENSWAIHSLQLETRNPLGFDIKIRQVYSPVQNVWLPVNQRYNLDGKIMGAAGNAQFIISQTFNSLKVNPAFVEDVKIVDEKFEKPAVSLSNKDIKGQKLEDKIAKQKEYSTKDFKKLLKEYEKQEYQAKKERKEEVEVSRNDSTVIDSLAGKRSNAFWDSLRTVPLTSAERISYVKRDSLKIVRKIEVQKDSTKAVRDSTKKNRSSKTFKPGQLISGNTWNFTNRTALTWDSPLQKIYYNTVEGYTFDMGLRLRYFLRKPERDSTRRRVVNKPTPDLTIGGAGRYEFGMKRLIGTGSIGYTYKGTSIGIMGGRWVNQFNPNEPISPFLNSVTSLLFEKNYAKLYQRDFLRLGISARPFENRINVSGSLEYAERTELANYKENLKPWIDWNQFSYTPNRPTNAELGSGAFPVNQALTLNLAVSGKLAATRYRIRNGRRVASRNNSPELTLNYRKGVPFNSGNTEVSDVDYDFVQAGLSHSFETGIRSRLSYNVSAGGFLNDKTVFFPDFKHFQGNEFFLQQGDPTSIFRMLPYYQYSTGKRFVEGHVLMEYRKFLITQLTLVRLTGLKENLFVHYLGTPNSKNYTEVGYALDGLIPGIFPFFRVEVISQWQDWQYQKLGFRIGTTLKFR